VVHGADRGTMVTEWRRRVHEGWGDGRHWHTIDGTDALVRRVVDEPTSATEVLAELGRRCALDGHSLDNVTAWTAELIKLSPRRVRRRLDSRDAAVALAAGWADGALQRRHSRAAGFASLGALRLALIQHYERCACLGIDPVEVSALVVLDADSGLLSPVARAAAMEALAVHVSSHFTDGEPTAATPTGRVLVLAERTPDLAREVREVVIACEASPLLAGCLRVLGWVERLPSDPTLVVAFLADLAS